MADEPIDPIAERLLRGDREKQVEMQAQLDMINSLKRNLPNGGFGQGATIKEFETQARLLAETMRYTAAQTSKIVSNYREYKKLKEEEYKLDLDMRGLGQERLRLERNLTAIGKGNVKAREEQLHQHMSEVATLLEDPNLVGGTTPKGTFHRAMQVRRAGGIRGLGRYGEASVRGALGHDFNIQRAGGQMLAKVLTTPVGGIVAGVGAGVKVSSDLYTKGIDLPIIGNVLPGIPEALPMGQTTGEGVGAGFHRFYHAFGLGMNPFDQISRSTALAIVNGVASKGFRGAFGDALSDTIVHVVKKTGADWEKTMEAATFAVRQGNMNLTEFTASMDHLHDVARLTNTSITDVIASVTDYQHKVVEGAGPSSGYAGLLTGTAIGQQYPKMQRKNQVGAIFTSDAAKQMARIGAAMQGQSLRLGQELTPQGQLFMASGLQNIVQQHRAIARAQGLSIEQYAAQLAATGAGQSFFGTNDIELLIELLNNTDPHSRGRKGPTLFQRIKGQTPTSQLAVKAGNDAASKARAEWMAFSTSHRGQMAPMLTHIRAGLSNSELSSDERKLKALMHQMETGPGSVESRELRRITNLRNEQAGVTENKINVNVYVDGVKTKKRIQVDDARRGKTKDKYYGTGNTDG